MNLGGVSIFECLSFSETGHYHRMHGLPNEDYISIRRNDSLAVMVICDGAGGLGTGKVAAQLTAKQIAEELHSHFKEFYFSDSGSAKRRIEQLVHICLNKYAATANIVPSDLACTILTVALDREGRCVCFHLGDGIIFRKKKQNTEWDVVSSPRNGLIQNTTYLTMNCDIYKELQYYRWKDDELQSILMLTDGASEHLLKRSGQRGWEFSDVCETTIANMKKHLDSVEPQDDYSGGMISRSDGQLSVNNL